MNALKKRLAYLLATVLLIMSAVPTIPTTTAEAASKNRITELGILELPDENTIAVGDFFNFNPDIIATERGKGRTTGIVWWEINKETNTAGVSSSRWGYVYPVYSGSFEIRALAFANAEDLNAWKAARKANGNVADETATANYATSVTDWVTINVTSDKEGYAVARTQYQLNLALKNREATDIHIQTDKEVSFTIAAKNYTTRTLTVNAPNAEVENAGRFAQINIWQIKASTFIEKAIGNTIHVNAPSARIVVDKGARIRSLELAPQSDTADLVPEINIVGQGGSVNQVNISTPGKFAITSGSEQTLRVGNIEIDAAGNLSFSSGVTGSIAGESVSVEINETAKDTKIETAAKLTINANADVELVINNSEDSTQIATAVVNLLKAIKVAIAGNAEDTVINVTKDAAGAIIASDVTVEINASADVKVELGEGAKDSVVKRDENVKVEATEESSVDVTIVNPDGSTDTVAPGSEVAEVTPAPTEIPATPEPTETPTTPIPTGSPVTPSPSTPTPLPFVDHDIDWKDANLEAAMREKTGITDRAIRLSDVYDLETLSLNRAGIENIEALGELVNLDYLGLNSNNISDISALKNLKNLTILDLFSNQVSDLSPLKDLTNLTGLQLSQNPIANIDALAGLVNLTELQLQSGNFVLELSDISALKNLKKLTHLQIWGSQVNDITPLKDLTALQILHLPYNKITDISALENLTNLKQLYIEAQFFNSQTITGSAITGTHVIKGMKQLERLSLSNLLIDDFSFLNDVTELKLISLWCTNVSDNDLGMLCNLEKLTYLTLGRNSALHDVSILKTLKVPEIDLDLRDCPNIPEEMLEELKTLFSNLRTQ